MTTSLRVNNFKRLLQEQEEFFKDVEDELESTRLQLAGSFRIQDKLEQELQIAHKEIADLKAEKASNAVEEHRIKEKFEQELQSARDEIIRLKAEILKKGDEERKLSGGSAQDEVRSSINSAESGRPKSPNPDASLGRPRVLSSLWQQTTSFLNDAINAEGLRPLFTSVKKDLKQAQAKLNLLDQPHEPLLKARVGLDIFFTGGSMHRVIMLVPLKRLQEKQGAWTTYPHPHSNIPTGARRDVLVLHNAAWFYFGTYEGTKVTSMKVREFRYLPLQSKEHLYRSAHPTIRKNKKPSEPDVGAMFLSGELRVGVFQMDRVDRNEGLNQALLASGGWADLSLPESSMGG